MKENKKTYTEIQMVGATSMIEIIFRHTKKVVLFQGRIQT